MKSLLLVMAAGVVLVVAGVHFSASGDPAPPAPTPATDLVSVHTTGPATTSTVGLQVDGMGRSYELMRPLWGQDAAESMRPGPAESMRPGPALPLVVVLHGAYITGPAEVSRTGFGALADAGDAVVVAPQSVGPAWNSVAGCCGEAAAQHVDDAAFVTAVVTDAQRRAHIDPARVYVVGYSSGGKLAYNLACTDRPALAAVATYGAGPQLPCPRAAPLTFIVGYGDKDINEPMLGEAPNAHGVHQPTATTVAQLRTRDGCASTPTQQRTVGTAALSTFGACRSAATVSQVVWHGSTHQWPGSAPGVAPDATGKALFWPMLSAARHS